MSDTKFTPGPWEVLDDFIVGMTDYGDNAIHICECDNYDVGDDTAMKNMHLIAAAPEMYEVLAIALNEKCGHCKHQNEPGELECQTCYCFVGGKIKKVLAKARGEEK